MGTFAEGRRMREIIIKYRKGRLWNQRTVRSWTASTELRS